MHFKNAVTSWFNESFLIVVVKQGQPFNTGNIKQISL